MPDTSHVSSVVDPALEMNPPLRTIAETQPDETHIKVIRDFAEIAEIRHLWDNWRANPNSDPDFCTMIMRTMPGVIRPHILVLYRGGSPRAMMVGRFENSSVSLKIGYRTLLQTKARVLTFIYRGFLGETSPENAKIFVQEILESLRHREADAAMLSGINVESPVRKFAAELPGILCRDYSPRMDLHRSMDLPATYEGVTSALSGKVRKNLKSQAKKIEQDFAGQVRIRVFREPYELNEMLRDVETIAGKTYQRGLGVGFVTTPEMINRFELESKMGWLRSFVLYLGDRPIAFWIGTLYQNVFYSGFMGYDPEFGKYSTGMYLIMKTIEDFCGIPDSTRPTQIDFGFGDAQYKQVLGNAEWQESSVYVFAPSIKGYQLNFVRVQGSIVNRMAMSALAKTSLLAKTKRIWRDKVMKR